MTAVPAALPRAHALASGADAGMADGPSVSLPYDERHRRRLVVTADGGERILIDLSEATRLADGDRLALDDGRILTVRARPEPVADITADAHTLVRLAWHLGNRHTPAEVRADRLRIRRDHILEAMVERLGGRLNLHDAPFDPEPGAYHDGGGHHHHD